MPKKLFEIDKRHFDLADIMLKDVKRGVARVMQNTVNKTLTYAKEELYTEVVDEYAIKGSPFKKSDIKRVTARPTNLNGFLHIRGRTLSINKFQFNPRTPQSQRRKTYEQRKRVSTEIHRGKIETWNNAFVAKLPKTVDVLTRSGKFSHKRNWAVKTKPRKNTVKGREFTKSRYTTNLPAMTKYVLTKSSKIESKVSQFFENELSRQIASQLDKVK